MSQFWESIRQEVTLALLALIPILGGALRAWLRARTRRLEAEGAAAWERADRLTSSAPGRVDESMRETWAVDALVERGMPAKQAVRVAQQTRTEPIPVFIPADRRAMPPPAPSSRTPDPDPRERETLPGAGVKPPRG